MPLEKRIYQLAADSKRGKKKKDHLMRDTKNHFILMMNAAQGVMGYWDKGRQVQVYTLRLSADRSRITVEVERDEGQGKKPHDRIFALICALIAGAAAFGILWFLLQAGPVACGAGTAVCCAAAFLLVCFIYRQEHQRFYRLLDRYMKEIHRAQLVRQ